MHIESSLTLPPDPDSAMQVIKRVNLVLKSKYGCNL